MIRALYIEATFAVVANAALKQMGQLHKMRWADVLRSAAGVVVMFFVSLIAK
jgi:hypothetical protein